MKRNEQIKKALIESSVFYEEASKVYAGLNGDADVTETFDTLVKTLGDTVNLSPSDDMIREISRMSIKRAKQSKEMRSKLDIDLLHNGIIHYLVIEQLKAGDGSRVIELQKELYEKFNKEVYGE